MFTTLYAMRRAARANAARELAEEALAESQAMAEEAMALSQQQLSAKAARRAPCATPNCSLSPVLHGAYQYLPLCLLYECLLIS